MCLLEYVITFRTPCDVKHGMFKFADTCQLLNLVYNDNYPKYFIKLSNTRQISGFKVSDP